MYIVDRGRKKRRYFCTRYSIISKTATKRDALCADLLFLFSRFVICLMMIQIIELFIFLQFRVASRRVLIGLGLFIEFQINFKLKQIRH